MNTSIAFRPGFRAAVLSAMMTLAACDRDGTGPDKNAVIPASGQEQPVLNPEQLTAFDGEVMSIKARLPEGAPQNEALRALRSRFGFPVAPGEAPEAVLGPLQSEAGAEEVPQSLGKAAARSVWKRWLTLNFTYPSVIYHAVTVPAGATLVAYTQRIDASLDPYMVAFYNPDKPYVSDWDPFLNLSQVKILGLDDDGFGSLNSRIAWHNSTGKTYSVGLIVLAYRADFPGRGRLLHTINSVSGETRTGMINGVRYPKGPITPPGGCLATPTQARIGLRQVAGGNYGQGILAVSKNNMTGANIRGISNYEVLLPHILKNNGSDFIMVYSDDPTGSQYPIDSQWQAWQDDKFSCP